MEDFDIVAPEKEHVDLHKTGEECYHLLKRLQELEENNNPGAEEDVEDHEAPVPESAFKHLPDSKLLDGLCESVKSDSKHMKSDFSEVLTLSHFWRRLGGHVDFDSIHHLWGFLWTFALNVRACTDSKWLPNPERARDLGKAMNWHQSLEHEAAAI